MFEPYDDTIFASVGSPQFYDEYADYWTAAKLYCASKGGQLPNGAQLAEIATMLYGDRHEISTSDTDYNNNSYDSDQWDSTKDVVFEALGIPADTSNFNLWSHSEGSSCCAWGRNFYDGNTGYDNIDRNYDYWAICVGD